jgi:hypothetical protein
MTVILKDTVPPITEIAKLVYAAVAVYSLMYQSAYQDLRYDKRMYRKWKDRSHCGGPTNWSHKAIAETLHMVKAKVINAIDLLLDNGFIQAEGLIPSSKGSKYRIYRVVHPYMFDAVRHAMSFFTATASARAKQAS